MKVHFVYAWMTPPPFPASYSLQSLSHIIFPSPSLFPSKTDHIVVVAPHFPLRTSLHLIPFFHHTFSLLCMWCMATARPADEGQLEIAPNLDTRSCSPHTYTCTHTHKHTHRRRRIGGIALCKIITMHLHSLWCGFVSIIRLEKSWIFTHTLSNYDNLHYS